MSNPSAKRRPAELVLPLLLLGGVLLLAVKAGAAVFPFVLSVAAAYLLNPVVNFFESRGFKRLHVVTAIYLVAGLLSIFLIIDLYNLAVQEIQLFQEQLPVYSVKLKQLASGLEDRLVRTTPFSRDMYTGWLGLAGQKVAGFAEAIPGFLFRLLPGLTLLVLVPFITFFLLVEGRDMLDAFLDLLPSRHVEMALHILSEVDQSLGNYLRGVLVDAMIMFSLALVGLTVLQLEYAGGVALVMGIGSLVPYVGAIMGALVGGTVAFIQFSSAAPVLQVLLLFLGLRFIDDWFLQPFILERAVRVHPIVIVFSLLAGAELFGIWGVIFAMPVTCILKVFLGIAIELHRTEFNWKPRQEPTRISIPYI